MNKATLELFVACIFWGFGFIAIIWALDGYSPLAIMTLRFLLVGLCAIPAWLGSRRFRTDFTPALFRMTFGPAFFLAITLLLQTWGLKYTSATNSGFITTLYVLFTPLAESLLRRRWPSRRLRIAVMIALTGTALICQIHTMQRFNLGDVLTLFCAWTAVAQFLSLSRILPSMTVSPFAFNLSQSIWIAVLTGSCMLLFEGVPHLVTDIHQRAFWGLAILAYGASFCAFLLQIRAQRVLSASTASIICLLESPFAALFAVWLLNEQFSSLQMAGGLLIFYASILAVRDATSAIVPIPEKL